MGLNLYSLRASWAVILFVTSRSSIPLIRSFALSDILGQGSDSRSSSPSNTFAYIPSSVSNSDYVS